MNRTVFLFLFSTFFLWSYEGKSENPFRTLTNTFQNQEQLQFSELGKKTIKLYIKEKNPSPEVQQVLSHIEQLNILKFKGNKEFKVALFVEKFNRCFPVGNYTPINVQKDSVQCKMVYIRETNNQITDLLVAEVGQQRVSLVEIKVEIYLERIALLKDALNI